MTTLSIAAMTAINLVLIAFVLFRRSKATGFWSFVLSLTVFLLLPGLITLVGGYTQLEQSKSTDFCLSCHVMEPYGTSLLVDESASLPAHHYQNRRVPREKACYTCHTTYTMYGGLNAKYQGVKHLYVNYLGTIPDSLELYQPYQNRECLHCHAGARIYEEMHADMRTELETSETSCLDCHDLAHDTSGSKELWKGNP